LAARAALPEQRKRIARRIKQLQPKASNRAIGKMLGVTGRTVDRDVATNVAADEQETPAGQGAAGPNGATELNAKPN
jgi:hypothetical protein